MKQRAEFLLGGWTRISPRLNNLCSHSNSELATSWGSKALKMWIDKKKVFLESNYTEHTNLPCFRKTFPNSHIHCKYTFINEKCYTHTHIHIGKACLKSTSKQHNLYFNSSFKFNKSSKLNIQIHKIHVLIQFI